MELVAHMRHLMDIMAHITIEVRIIGIRTITAMLYTTTLDILTAESPTTELTTESPTTIELLTQSAP
jgi:hypothetical protein